MEKKIILDRKELMVNSIISRNELLRLAGITEEMELKAINSYKSAGTGWEVYRQTATTNEWIKEDELLDKDEVIDLNNKKYYGLPQRKFFTACTNTCGG